MVPRFSLRRPSLYKPLAWLLVFALTTTQVAGLFVLSAPPVQAQSAQEGSATDTSSDATAQDSQDTLQDSNAAESAPVQTAQANDAQQIVYLDANGFVRVIDPCAIDPNLCPLIPGDRPGVLWSSPDGGWQDFALGDVNGDGDMEIIVVNETSGLITLKIYDPVVASGAISDPSQVVNGIPWDTLYETTFTGAAPIIAAGDFDRAIDAHEIFIGFRSFAGGFRAIVLNVDGEDPNGINPATQLPTGRAWKEHIDQVLDVPFEDVAVGDINNNGLDDIALMEGAELPDAAVRVYETENNFRFLGRFGRSGASLFNLAVGDVILGGGKEIVTSSSAGNRNNLFIIGLRGNNLSLIDDENDEFQFVPSPRYVFLADLTGNGDKEVFFLRDYDGTERDRLIMRNLWGNDQSDTADFEVRLDSDNGYKVGAGGDFNNNGREEIAIMRDNRIRLYTDPVRGPGAFVEYNVDTNSRNIEFGNLDAAGIVEGPQIQVTADTLEGTVEHGGSLTIGQIDVANVGTAEAVQISLQALNPNDSVAGFINFSPSSTGTTPASFSVVFNAAGLNEGVYTGNIRVNSPNENITNLPTDIPFSVTVLPEPPPAFDPTTGGTGFFYYRCEDYFQALEDSDEIENGNGENDNGENGNGENGNDENDNGENGNASAATLDMPTAPQTVTVGFQGDAGGQVTIAVVDAPDGAGSAEAGSGGATFFPRIVDAFVDHNGDVVVVDDEGNRTLVEMSTAQTAAADQQQWPSLVPWVTSVRSNSNVIPLQVELVGNVYPVLQNEDGQPNYLRRAAMMVVVGDQLYGPPPRNVRVVPLSLVCANDFLGLPGMFNQR